MKPVIQIENLSKQYRLGTIGTGTLSNDLKRWYYTAVRGKEDPFIKVGDHNDRSIKGDSEFVWALKDINVSVCQGDILGVIGKNGAGKSTLLKILSKVTGPTKGSIKWDGRIGSLLEVGTGFHPELTGLENIYLNGAILGMTKMEIRSKLEEIVDFSGCERYIDTPVKRYSSGMIVRLGFSVAAHLEPEILVVDEVLAVGDAEFQKKAIGKMQDVSNKSGRTILFVSHNMGLMSKLCTKGVLLKNGQVDAEGTISEVIDAYVNNHSSERIYGYECSSISAKFVQLKKVWIKDAQMKNGVFDIMENVEVEFEYEIRKDVMGLAFFFNLELNGQPIFVSFDTDNEPQLLEIRKAGVYYAKVVLPHLKAGEYSISGGLSIVKQVKEEFRDLLRPLSFTVTELSTDATFKSYSHLRPGYLLAELDWQTKKV